MLTWKRLLAFRRRLEEQADAQTRWLLWWNRLSDAQKRHYLGFWIARSAKYGPSQQSDN